MGPRHIVGVDIEQYGRRHGSKQGALRKALFGLLDDCLDGVGISALGRDLREQGDGGLILIDASIPVRVLCVDLADALARGLAEHNRRTVDPDLRLRLRMAVHTGQIVTDPYGVSGEGLGLAARLLDAPVLRGALARASTDLVVLVSDPAYQSVAAADPAGVRSEPGPAGAGGFQPVQVTSKETSTTAWLRVAGGQLGVLVSLAGCPYRGLYSFDTRDAPLFFGRDRLISDLLGRLDAAWQQGPRMLAVVGASGAGKSSLLRAGLLAALAQGRAGPPERWQSLLLTPGAEPVGALADALEGLADQSARPPGWMRAELSAAPGRCRQLALRALASAAANQAFQGDAAGPSAPQAPPVVASTLTAADTSAGGDGTSVRHQAPPSHHGLPRLVVVVDQLEELFTACEDEAMRRAFITALHALAAPPNEPNSVTTADPEPDGLGAAPAAAVCAPEGEGAGSAAAQVWVVLGLRADFYDRCLAYQKLVDVLQHQQVVLGAMSAAELRQVIELPAALANLTLEPGLVDLLLEHVGAGPLDPSKPEPGALPLLSYALQQTWHDRTGQQLTIEGYQRSGGLHGAIERGAEFAWRGLDPGGQAVAKRLLLELIAFGEDGAEDARRRVFLDELAAEAADGDLAAVRQVLDAFVAARLVTVGAEHARSGGDRAGRHTVELAHEALLRAWPRLRGWLAHDRDNLLKLRQLAQDAKTWEAAGRSPDVVYRGARLAEVRGWVDDPSRSARLGPQARAFLLAGIHEDERHTRRRRLLTGIVAGLAALTLLIGGIAYYNFDSAQAHNKRAASVRLADRATQLESAQPDLAALLSVTAFNIEPTEAATTSLLAALQTFRWATSVLVGHGGPVDSVAFSPDGGLLASGGSDQQIILWDPDRHVQVGDPLRGARGAITHLEFSSTGRLVSGGPEDDRVLLWDPHATPPSSTALPDHQGGVVDLALDRSGTRLAVLDGHGQVTVWALDRPRPERLWARPAPNARVITFEHRDRLLAATAHPTDPGPNQNYQAQFAVVDVATGRTLRRLPPLTITTGADGLMLAFTPDGQQLAASDEVTFAQWPVQGGAATARIDELTAPFNRFAFSPDGVLGLGFQADRDEPVFLDLEHARSIRGWLTPAGRVRAAAFSRSGQLALADDRMILLHDTDALTSRAVTPNPTDPLAAAISPSDELLAVLDVDGSLRLHTADSRPATQLATIPNPVDPYDGSARLPMLTFSADGSTLLAARANQQARLLLWETATRQPLRVPHELSTTDPDHLALNARGTQLATASATAPVQLWPLREERAVPQELPHPRPVTALAFHPAEDLLAAGDAAGAIHLWDVAGQPRRINIHQHGSAPIHALSFSRNDLLAVLDDHELTVLEPQTGTSKGSVQHGMDAAGPDSQAILSADGSAIATSERFDSLEVTLWRATDLTRLGRLDVAVGTFTPDSHTAIWYDRFDDFGSMPLDPAAWARQLCAILRRDLTPTQWERLVPELPYQATCTRPKP